MVADLSQNILIVAGNSQDRAAIRALLNAVPGCHYFLVEAASGTAGLNAIRDAGDRRFDGILLGIDLPDLTATAFLARLGGAVEDPPPVTVLAPARATAEDTNGWFAAGAEDVVDKASLASESLARNLDNAARRRARNRSGRTETPPVSRPPESAALTESLWRFANASPDVIWLSAENPGDCCYGNVAYVSPAFRNVWGRSEQELAADPRILLDTIHPDDLDAVLSQSRRAAGGTPCEHEYRVVRPDGGIRWVRDRIQPIAGPAGEIRLHLGIARDITEYLEVQREVGRLRAELEERVARRTAELEATLGELYDSEQRLHGALEHLRLAQESAGVGTWDWDVPLDIMEWSPHMFALFGLDPEHAKPNLDTWRSVLHPDDRGRVDSMSGIHQSESDRFDWEYRILLPTGEERWINSRGRVRRDDQGRPLRMAGVSMDITERKRAAAAIQADREKDHFLAVLAHELRNPLATFRNGLQILQRSLDDPEIAERTLQMMLRQSRQLARLVEDLMDLTAINQGKIKLHSQTVDLAEILQQAAETSSAAISQAGHVLRIGPPAEPIRLEADAPRLAQVISNLLNNAAKYTPGGGNIELTAEREGDEAVISVRDNGVGIPAHMLNRVFELFTQVDVSRTRSQGGLGIGLNLVKRLVELHGGRVEARSEGPDHGSEFSIRLPLPPRPASAPAPAAPDPARPGGLRILVADDHTDAAASLAVLLRMQGHDVRIAHDGQEALTVAAEFHPRVAILDLGMPRLNGLDTCRRLRELPGGRALLAIALTGWGQERDRQATRAAGFDQHFVKPVDFDELEQLLAGLSSAAPS